MSDVLSIIRAEATKNHVDPNLAIAIARVEDPSLDPNATGDRGYFYGGKFVPDNNAPPTSFGLYQLHQGGLLGALTPQQALNPTANADVALSHLYRTEQGHPNVRDPGTLAALSQGPADPSGYAQKVNALLANPGALTAGPNPHDSGGIIGSITGGIGDAAGAVGGAASSAAGAVWDVAKGAWGIVTSPFELAKTIWNALTSSKTWIRVGLFVGGALLVLLGLYRVFSGGSGAAPVPIPV